MYSNNFPGEYLPHFSIKLTLDSTVYSSARIAFPASRFQISVAIYREFEFFGICHILGGHIIFYGLEAYQAWQKE